MALPGDAIGGVEQIARFKDLNDEQRNLLLSARKEPGKYVEAVVLADNSEALFRSVSPPLTLSMTEKQMLLSLGPDNYIYLYFIDNIV